MLATDAVGEVKVQASGKQIMIDQDWRGLRGQQEVAVGSLVKEDV